MLLLTNWLHAICCKLVVGKIEVQADISSVKKIVAIFAENKHMHSQFRGITVMYVIQLL